LTAAARGAQQGYRSGRRNGPQPNKETDRRLDTPAAIRERAIMAISRLGRGKEGFRNLPVACPRSGQGITIRRPTPIACRPGRAFCVKMWQGPLPSSRPTNMQLHAADGIRKLSHRQRTIATNKFRLNATASRRQSIPKGTVSRRSRRLPKIVPSVQSSWRMPRLWNGCPITEFESDQMPLESTGDDRRGRALL
jgi:hypothetical protein